MKNTGLFVAIGWLITVAIAYGVGWWSGVKSVTQVAAGAAQTGFPILMGVLLIAAIAIAIVAFRFRGFLGNHGLTPRT